MKKIFLLALFILLFSCSNDGFEKPKLPDGSDISAIEIPVKCLVEKGESQSCYEISRSACGIIGGREVDQAEKCISFECGWSSKEVEYGQKATLSFAFKSDSMDCSLKEISPFPLGTGEYIMSSSAIPGLSFSEEDKVISAEAIVVCGEDKKEFKQYCKSLTVKSAHINFACGWNFEEIKYGEKSKLSFAFTDSASANIAKMEHCSLKISPLDTGEYIMSSSAFNELSYSKNTIVKTEATLTCGGGVLNKKCTELKVDSVPGPKIEGTLSFKKSDLVINDTNYFFIGTKIDSTFINSTMKVTNDSVAECGAIKIKIAGSPAKLGTSVKATAVVHCKYTDTLELASIDAEVLPDPAIGDCKLTGTSKTTMRSIDTLTIEMKVDSSYGRCKEVEYSFSSSSSYGKSNSLNLASYGNKELNNINARVTCSTVSGKDTTVIKKCPTVSVASYVKTQCGTNENRDAISIAKGKTILEFTCNKTKSDFYISCRPGPKQLPDYSQKHTYTVEITGHSIGNTDNDIREVVGDNGYNFPDIIVQESENLYVYPKPITITAEEDLKCGIW